eukprot:4852452-Amphidinium_carterae.3
MAMSYECAIRRTLLGGQKIVLSVTGGCTNLRPPWMGLPMTHAPTWTFLSLSLLMCMLVVL